MTEQQTLIVEEREKERREKYAKRSRAAIFFNKVFMKDRAPTNLTLDSIALVFAYIETLLDTEKSTDEVIVDIEDYLVKIS